eukprot:970616-Rhodomonas_salina.1
MPELEEVTEALPRPWWDSEQELRRGGDVRPVARQEGAGMLHQSAGSMVREVEMLTPCLGERRRHEEEREEKEEGGKREGSVSREESAKGLPRMEKGH